VKQIRGNSLVVYSIPVIFFYLILVTALFPVRGWSQQQQQGQVLAGEFSLSREVHWENSVLPMGDYIYYVDSSRWPAVVRVQQKDGAFSGMFMPLTLLKPGNPRQSGIVMGTIGNDAYVKGLYLKDGAGEYGFPMPAAETEEEPEPRVHARESSASLALAAQYITIFNPNRDKISVEEIEKVYLGACEAVEKEYNRPAPIRPHLILRLGGDGNLLRYPMREVQLKKWDEYRFADAVVELALHDMVSREDRVRLRDIAVSEAGATVNVCELKDCVN
jgi:hypothetical protein